MHFLHEQLHVKIQPFRLHVRPNVSTLLSLERKRVNISPFSFHFVPCVLSLLPSIRILESHRARKRRHPAHASALARGRRLCRQAEHWEDSLLPPPVSLRFLQDLVPDDAPSRPRWMATTIRPGFSNVCAVLFRSVVPDHRTDPVSPRDHLSRTACTSALTDLRASTRLMPLASSLSYSVAVCRT